MAAIAGLLRNIPLLSGLSEAQLRSVEGIAKRCSFRSGDVIAHVGEPAAAAYYLIDGPVECRPADGPGDNLTVPTGATLLELAMIVEIDANATCVALGSVKMLEIGREPLHGLMETDTGMTDSILESLTSRLVDVAAAMREADETFAELQKAG